MANLDVSATITATLSDINSTGVAVPTYTDESGSTVVIEATEYRDRNGAKLSRSRDGRTLTRSYVIKGTLDTIAADKVLPRIGDPDADYPEFTAKTVDCNRYAVGENDWERACFATVTFENATTDGEVITDPSQNAENEGGGLGGGGGTQNAYGFSVANESYKITEAIAQTNYTNAGASNTKSRAINKTPDGRVEGVDIDAPLLQMTETHYFSERAFQQSYRETLLDTVKKTNSAEFRGFAIGEVLFESFSANKAGNKWAVTFNFTIRRNETQTFKIYPTWGAAGVDVELDVKGWEYVWVQMAKRKTDTEVLEVPLSVHVAQVYQTASFADLGIGTGVVP